MGVKVASDSISGNRSTTFIYLTLAVYKFELGEQIVSAGITAIYVAANLIGGIIIGKCAGQRRFLWGLGNWSRLFCAAVIDHTGSLPHGKWKYGQYYDHLFFFVPEAVCLAA